MKMLRIILILMFCFWPVFANGEAGDPVVENKEITGSLKFDVGATVDEFSTDDTLVGNSDTAVPTEKAVKSYVDGQGGGGTAFAIIAALGTL